MVQSAAPENPRSRGEGPGGRATWNPPEAGGKVGRGTGQGLAIAHDVVVHKHGGTIDVESEVGRGTTFVIRLPLVESAAVKDAA